MMRSKILMCPLDAKKNPARAVRSLAIRYPGFISFMYGFTMNN